MNTCIEQYKSIFHLEPSAAAESHAERTGEHQQSEGHKITQRFTWTTTQWANIKWGRFEALQCDGTLGLEGYQWFEQSNSHAVVYWTKYD